MNSGLKRSATHSLTSGSLEVSTEETKESFADSWNGRFKTLGWKTDDRVQHLGKFN